jgi:hypothetical protein
MGLAALHRTVTRIDGRDDLTLVDQRGLQAGLRALRLNRNRVVSSRKATKNVRDVV